MRFLTFSKQFLCTGSIFVFFTLTACSNLPSFPSNSAEAENPETTPEVLVTDLVVEDLISEAGELGDIDITLAPDTISIDTPEQPETIVIEPETPTITMTANRVVELAINDYLQNRRTQIVVWAERSHTYFPMIERIFEEEGIPDELKYIALGESGLRPTVRSGAGAVGMWQFMPATGRGAGLKIDTWVDERRDPEKATRAAAIHLKELYESYSGNWHLVLAGYNCSYRCISRAVRRAGGSISDPPSFWEIYPYLPAETRGFIPKFIATALLVSDPNKYGINVEDFGQEIAYDIIDVLGMLSVEDAAMLAGTDMTTIRTLNPELRTGSLPDSLSPYPLRIPFGSFQNFTTAFNNLPLEAKQAPGEYIVKSGDTLDRISRNYNTSVEELQAMNGISGHLIRPRQKLLIPGTGMSTDISLVSTEARFVEYGENQYRPIKLTDEYQLVEQAGSTEEKPLMAVVLDADVEDDMLVPTIYRVRRGDTLGQISERFRISVRDIQQWNNLNGTTIFANQELTIHSIATSPSTRYTVRSGDNLGAIARRFGVSIENLKRWNGLSSNLIFPGQDLQLN